MGYTDWGGKRMIIWNKNFYPFVFALAAKPLSLPARSENGTFGRASQKEKLFPTRKRNIA